MTSSQDRDKRQAIRLLRRYRALPPEEQTRQRDSLIAHYRAKEFWNRVRENQQTGEFPLSGSREYLLHGRGMKFPVGRRSNGSVIYKKEDVNFLGKWLRQKETNPWTRNRVGGPTLPHRVHQQVMNATLDVPTFVEELSESIELQIFNHVAPLLDPSHPAAIPHVRPLANILDKLKSAIRAHEKGYINLMPLAVTVGDEQSLQRMDKTDMETLERLLVGDRRVPRSYHFYDRSVMIMCYDQYSEYRYYVPYIQLCLLEEKLRLDLHGVEVHGVQVHKLTDADMEFALAQFALALRYVREARELTKAYTPSPIVDATATYMEQFRQRFWTNGKPSIRRFIDYRKFFRSLRRCVRFIRAVEGE